MDPQKSLLRPRPSRAPPVILRSPAPSPASSSIASLAALGLKTLANSQEPSAAACRCQDRACPMARSFYVLEAFVCQTGSVNLRQPLRSSFRLQTHTLRHTETHSERGTANTAASAEAPGPPPPNLYQGPRSSRRCLRRNIWKPSAPGRPESDDSRR